MKGNLLMANANLTNARKAKNDEFYTQWSDIEKEVNAYLEFDENVFRDKTILLPADDPFESNFFKYFATHFNDFGLKKLIATSYDPSPIVNTQLELSLFDDNNEQDVGMTRKISRAYRIELTDVSDFDENGRINIDDVEAKLLAEKKHIDKGKKSKILGYLTGDESVGGYSAGDFRSAEVTKLLVYETNGLESEIKEWFKTINISGIPLNQQEIRNAIYSGPFITKAKEEFSNSQNANIQKWSAYIKGSPLRQEILEEALNWISTSQNISIDEYMSTHRKDDNLNELKMYFNAVIDWASTVFPVVEKEMRGLEWGRLYETYHKQSYNPQTVSTELSKLYEDADVSKKSGVFEYILSGQNPKFIKLLSIRTFSETDKRTIYKRQTTASESAGVSNCSYCVNDTEYNHMTHIWTFKEMEGDHITPWSKGGKTEIANLQMLCKHHNGMKTNN